MSHLLSVDTMSAELALKLIHRAREFKQDRAYPQYASCEVANLFYENSTRTLVSFELAAKRLGMSVINLNIDNSSAAKGEAIEDTVGTLAAMGVTTFVVRHVEAGLPQRLAEKIDGVSIINAGDGMHAHPTQALLDFMTIIETKPDLANLKIAIVGDLRHSRVANSLQCLCKKLGVGGLSLISPEVWQPQSCHFGHYTQSLAEGLAEADVVISLRIQRERLLTDETLDVASYCRDYAITSKHLKWARADAMVMHPGPINRGIEIDEVVADGAQSYILQQVMNGVFMRMAVLEYAKTLNTP